MTDRVSIKRKDLDNAAAVAASRGVSIRIEVDGAIYLIEAEVNSKGVANLNEMRKSDEITPM